MFVVSDVGLRVNMGLVCTYFVHQTLHDSFHLTARMLDGNIIPLVIGDESLCMMRLAELDRALNAQETEFMGIIDPASDIIGVVEFS
jgi:hypothetical protein